MTDTWTDGVLAFLRDEAANDSPEAQRLLLAHRDDRLHGIVKARVDEADRILDGLALSVSRGRGSTLLGEVELSRIVVAFAEMRRALYGE